MPAALLLCDCDITEPLTRTRTRRGIVPTSSMAIVGAPPHARGTDVPGRDLELQLASAFPECSLFVEKPVSSGPEDACWRVAEVLAKNGSIVGVGYMLRHLKGEI